MPSFRPATLLCAAVLLLTCAACSPTQSPQSSGTPGELSLPDEPSVPVLSVPDSSVPKPPDTPSDPPASEVPDTPDEPQPELPDPTVPQTGGSDKPAPDHSQTQQPVADPSDEPGPEAPVLSYDFSRPVPESQAVANDYFADAAFVGDSRTDGFYLFSGVKQGKNLSSNGLSIFTFDKKKVLTIGGTSYTLLEALALQEYGKVYLSFGVNELGYINTDAFYQSYCRAIDAIRACQPNAVLYAQTLIPLNEDRVAAAGGAKYLNNDRLRLYNDLIRKAAQEKQIPLLDLYSAFAVDGALPADASRDGVHLNADFCKKQLDYLKTHTVDFDTLYPQPDTEPEVSPDETIDIPASDPDPDPDAGSLLPEAEHSSLPAGTDPAASGQ